MAQVYWNAKTNKIIAHDLQLHIKLPGETGLLPLIFRDTTPPRHSFCRVAVVTCEIDFLPPKAIGELAKGDGSNKHPTEVERTGSTDFV